LASALGPRSTVRSKRLHQPARTDGIRWRSEEHCPCRDRFQLASPAEPATGYGDTGRRPDLGRRIPKAAESLCPRAFPHSCIDHSCAHDISQRAQQFQGRVQILRLRESFLSSPLSASGEGLGARWRRVDPTPDPAPLVGRGKQKCVGHALYGLIAALLYSPSLAERLGRAVAAGFKSSVFRFIWDSDLKISRRGKSEHYRAASPLTAGRSSNRATTSATENRPAMRFGFPFGNSTWLPGRKARDPTCMVMGEMVRPARA